MNNKNSTKYKRGIALLFSIVMIVILTVVAAVLAQLAFRQLQFGGLGERSEQAYYAAERLFECAYYEVSKNHENPAFSNCGTPSGDLYIMDETSNGKGCATLEESKDGNTTHLRVDGYSGECASENSVIRTIEGKYTIIVSDDYSTSGDY